MTVGSWPLVALGVVALLGSTSAARALCIHDGKLYATTTMPQEFREASLVVRGTALSANDFAVRDPEDGTVTSYRARIDETFKGKQRAYVTVVSPRDSGAFYLDLRTEYLLFLSPSRSIDWSAVGPNDMVVNYNCGQSQSWAAISPIDRHRLRALGQLREVRAGK